MNRISASAWRAGRAPTSPKSAERVAAGRVAKAAGDGHETALQALHDLYRRQGRADIRRRPHEVGMRPEGRRMVVTYRQPTGADFAGTLTGGRAIVVEAKTVAEGNVRGASLAGIKSWSDAELSELRECARHGGVALVLADVRTGEWAGRYLVPVDSAAWNIDREPVSLTGLVAETRGVVRVADADYLAVIESMGLTVSGSRWPHQTRA